MRKYKQYQLKFNLYFLFFIFVTAKIILSFSLAFLDKGLTISVPFPILNYLDYNFNPWRIKKAAIFIVSLCDTFC